MSETEGMVLCTRCGTNEVPAPMSIEDDPVCASCIEEMIHEAADAAFTRRQKSLTEQCVDAGTDWGYEKDAEEMKRAAFAVEPPTTTVDWNETSLHPTTVVPDETLGQVCRRMSGAPVYEFNNDEGGCPGYEDSCSNTLKITETMCPECAAKRDVDKIN